MPDQLQLRGGTTAEHSTFTGAIKEVTVDTTKKTAVVHDGTTAGGIALLRQDGSNSALALGSEGTPSLKWDANTGIFSPGEDQLAIVTGANRAITCTSTQAVGIKTANPNAALHVAGSTRVGADSAADAFLEIGEGATGNRNSYIDIVGDTTYTDYGLRVIRNNTGANATSELKHRGTGALNFTTEEAAAIVFNTTNSPRLTITSGGLVGIGTASPKSILTTQGNIVGLSETTHSLQHYQQAAASYTVTSIDSVISGASGSLVFKTAANWTNGNAVEQARIDSSGRLLVGTTTNFDPSANIQAQGEGLALKRNENGSTISNGLIRFYSGAGLTAQIFGVNDGAQSPGDTPGALVFSTTADGASSPTARMAIYSNGSTGVFATSADSIFMDNSAAAGTTVSYLLGRHGATGLGSGTVSFRVWTNGDVINTNNSYGAISDIKLKENIVDANSQWGDLKALQVRNYNFKEGQTHTQIGLVAQEVELVSPGLVSESPDRDEEGNDLGTVTKSVNYSVLYMKAVKALQEAMERIETLEAKVATLETL
jgi:hypothetical protein